MFVLKHYNKIGSYNRPHRKLPILVSFWFSVDCMFHSPWLLLELLSWSCVAFTLLPCLSGWHSPHVVSPLLGGCFYVPCVTSPTGHIPPVSARLDTSHGYPSGHRHIHQHCQHHQQQHCRHRQASRQPAASAFPPTQGRSSSGAAQAASSKPHFSKTSSPTQHPPDHCLLARYVSSALWLPIRNCLC